jgi:hypothetical protein
MASMSAQSLVRSSSALKTASAVQPTTGMVWPSKGTQRTPRKTLRIDGGILPPQPYLPVAFGGLQVGGRGEDGIGQRGEDLGGAIGPDEDVDVEIAGAAGLFGAVGEGDGAAEGVGEVDVLQRLVDLEQAIRQQAHEAGRLFSEG